mmetsp:Transcript_14540/g.35162  ORF Transcript_14540/g.35162 Transcript_14540/m.35162 type:complete len:199 (-) Transcript_14540:60-656(-)
MTMLCSNFRPGDWDVICARGKEAKNHTGNQRFRQKIGESTQEYASATSRLYKSLVVTSVVNWVRDASPNGGFVKEIDGMWYEVGDHLAREKVGQSLREQLHSQYKSSAKAKRRRKKEQEAMQAREMEETFFALDQMVQSDNRINQNMQNVQYQACTLPDPSDDMLLRLFEQNNANILQTISSDANLQQGIMQLTTFSC